jgi:multicomponent Na+:H+ antiporter subunit D
VELVPSIRPLLAVSVSALAAFLILLAGERRRNLRELWTILASVAKFSIVASMIPILLEGKIIECTIIRLSPGIALQFRVDAFGIFFATLASALWIATSIYSIGYMRVLNEHAQTRYFFCFALALNGALGVAFAGNLLTLFIFYEILTIATFPLVAHRETPEAIRGGRKYLAYLLTGAALVFFSMGLTYHLTGTLDFVGGGFLRGHGSDNILRLLFATFILGFGTKAALIPIHEWLPTAMVAPTPVSALLHAVAVVKAGVFCVLRVVLYVFGPQLLSDLSLWLILAAFSTINNLAIIIMGAALLSPSAIIGGIFHIAGHGFMKITLFFVAGAIYVKTHKENISELDGIGRTMPITMGSFAIGAMGIAGTPPAVGFISKWYLCLGSLEAKEIVFLFVLLTSALLDIAYFFPIIYNSFFNRPKEQAHSGFDEAPMLMVIPLTACAIISIILGIAPDAFFHFFQVATLAARNILGIG